MTTWRVQPFAWGIQETEGVFANFQEAIVFASKKARETRVRWAIFGDDHELDTIIAPEDKMPWEKEHWYGIDLFVRRFYR